MFCDKCGKKTVTKSVFCDNCGNSLIPRSSLKKIQEAKKIKQPQKFYGVNVSIFYTVIISLVALFGFAYFSFHASQSREVEQTKKLQQQIEQLVTKSQQEAAKSKTIEAKSAEEQQTAQANINALNQKIGELQQKQQSGQPIVSTSLSSADINKIISSVVRVICLSDSYETSLNIGSGTVWKFGDNPDYLVFTNAHVVSTTDGSNPYCGVSFPILPSGIPYYSYHTEFDAMGYINGADWALLKLTFPYDSQKSLTKIPVFSDYPQCKFSDVNIGDKVTVFGYPTAGGNNITVTEGNISGFSGNNYKVSSGIIDKGNSGGTALLNKTKCSLGIPTWVSVGEFSSVGIIQSWRTIYGDLSR